MKVINLYSGPGGGKSTISAGLFYKLKLQHQKVELVTEYAKDLVYSNRLEDMLDQQEYIFAKQNHRLHRLRNQVDWAIVDSPLLLSLVYSSDEWQCINEFRSMVRAINGTYDNINIVLRRPNVDFQQYGRRHDQQESELLDATIIEMLEANDQPYYVFEHNEGSLIVDDILDSDIFK